MFLVKTFPETLVFVYSNVKINIKIISTQHTPFSTTIHHQGNNTISDVYQQQQCINNSLSLSSLDLNLKMVINNDNRIIEIVRKLYKAI